MEAEIRQEIIPYVEQHYRIEKGREHRAIAGLSMGGGHALQMGLQHPELFAWVAGFSSASPHEALDETLEPLKPMWSQSPLRMLWVGCGKEDFLLERNQVFIQWLEQHGMAHEWVLTEGGHEWGVWRRYLTSLLPKLFQ